MNMKSCLLFDLDGTLLDSRTSVVEAAYATAERYVPGRFTRDAIKQRFGEPFHHYLHLLAALNGDATVEQIRAHFLAGCEIYYESGVNLFPYVRESLETLQASGYRMAIVTNKQRDFALRDLRDQKIFHLFETVVTLDDVKEGKPSPEPIQLALHLLQRDAHDAFMIGDSKYDLLAAKHSGVESVLLDWYGDVRIDEITPNYRYEHLQPLVDDLLGKKSQRKAVG